MYVKVKHDCLGLSLDTYLYSYEERLGKVI